MRKLWTAVLCATLAATAASSGPLAFAESPQQRLEQARAQKASAESTVAAAEARLAVLQKQYRQAESKLQLAARDTLTAYVAELSVSAQLAAAQQLLDTRAAEAYEMGPGLGLELLLGSQSPEDFASAQVYAEHVLQAGSDQVDQVMALRASLEQVTARYQARQDAVQAAAADLQALAAQISQQLTAARAVAAKAGLSVKRLEAEQQSLSNALGLDAATIADLVNRERGVDQSALLALLGPTHGRGCTIPSGLRDTGKRLGGLASWYGPGFAGHRTATGAIFDPRLFTAANKELPLNVFLRIHYKDRCAIVLVNDRGPYGGGRSFDLSQGAADYLGYLRAGVVTVSADLLVPAK